MYVSFLTSSDISLSWDTSERADLAIVPTAAEAEVKKFTKKTVSIGGELLLDLDVPLYEGKRSKVYRGTYCQKSVAVKVSRRAGSSTDASKEPTEVKYLKLLHHPNVVALVMSGSYVPSHMHSRLRQRSSGIPYETFIVMEYCDRGTLHQAIKKQQFSESLGLDQVITCALEIAQAMAHMHSKRIIHGALNTKHILLQSHSMDPRGFVCKV